MNLKSMIDIWCPSLLRPLLVRMENSPLGLRLASGMFWSIVGAVISRGLMLAATILVARMLGKAVYGELGMLRSTVGMLGIFAGFGLGLTATKHVAEFRRSDPARAGRILGIAGMFATITGGLMALGLYVFAPWLAEHTINAPHLAGTLRIGTLILFINTLNGAQTGALSGFEAFKTIAWVNLFVGLMSFPILLAGAYCGGLTGTVWALAINLGFNWILNHFALRREARRCNVPFTLRHCSRELPVLWKFSLPAALASSLVGPVNWACGAMLVNLPGGYGEMGILSVANQWYILLLFLPTSLAKVVLPVLSDHCSNNDTSQSLKTLVFAIKMNLIIVVPLVVAGSLASPYIMRLYGAGFQQGWPTLIVVLLTAGLLSIQRPVGQFIAASGRMWIGFGMNLGWALVFLVSTVLLVDQGSFGYATARMISYLAHGVWTIGFAIWLLQVGKRR